MYSSGISLISATVMMIDVNDLSVVKASNFTISNQISYAYPFTTAGSQHMVLVGLKALLGGDYQIAAIDFDNMLLPLIWGKKFYGGFCLIGCPVTDFPAYSLIHQSLLRSYQLTIWDDKPLFFTVNLNNGNVVGSFYHTSLGQANMKIVDMAFNEAKTTVYILIKHNNGFHIFPFYPTTSTFGTTKTSTTLEIQFVTSMNGYVYYGGQIKSNQNAFITNIPGEGNFNQNSVFALSSSASTFTTVSGYSLNTDILMIVTILLSFSSSTSSVPFVPAGTYVSSSVNTFSSDVIYQGGFRETYYVQENYSGQLVFSLPCSLSGSTPITSTIIAHPDTGTFPAWVALNADYQHIDVTAPAFTGSNDYFFAVRSVILGENVDKLVQITVYNCLVTN